MSKGNEILLRARTHFRNTRTPETLQKLAVPEWEAEIYYWPDMSVEESREVGQHIRMSNGKLAIAAGDLTDAAVTQLLFRARDAFGNRLFSEADETALRDTHPSVLTRLASEMGWSSRANLEDAEKN